MIRVLKTRRDLGLFFGSVLFSFLAFLPDDDEIIYILADHISDYFFLLAFMLFFSFYKKILPEINEFVILSYNVILAYFLIVGWSTYDVFIRVLLMLLIVISTGATLYPKKLPSIMQIGMYIWYMLISLSLFLMQFSFNSFDYFQSYTSIKNISILGIITSGMVFAVLSSRIYGLLYLIPIPLSKRMSMKSRLQLLKEYLEVLIVKYVDDQFSPLSLVMSLMVVLVVILLNHMHNLVSQQLLVNATFLLIPLLPSMHRTFRVWTKSALAFKRIR